MNIYWMTIKGDNKVLTIQGKDPIDACKRAFPELELTPVANSVEVCIELAGGQRPKKSYYVGHFKHRK